jgi:LysM repeat protein
MKIKSGTGTNKMKRFACANAVALFLLVNTPSGWCQQYLYTPTAVGSENNIPSKDGILVQEVSVQKGDSLYRISRKFSGHGSYFPQILLFNDIKDPNKIYPGNIFKIPVPRNTVSVQVDKTSAKKADPIANGRAAAVLPLDADTSVSRRQVPDAPSASVTEISTKDLKNTDTGKEKKRGVREKIAGTKKQTATREKQHTATAGPGSTTPGQLLFERAVKAYRQDDCRNALEMFDKFLAENMASPLAADASLYKAECYLKLSNQN